MAVHVGEIYGKRRADGSAALYSIVRIRGDTVTLQNLERDCGAFETKVQKLERGGYQLISQTPYVPLKQRTSRRAGVKPARCPYTVDFIEGRADWEKPVPVFPA
jgi:hypothetical protein